MPRCLLLALPFALCGCTISNAPPRPDAGGVVVIQCEVTEPAIALYDCDRKAEKICGGRAREISHNTGPRLGAMPGGEVDVVARYQCPTKTR